jgi:hypothetical protein
VRAVLLPAISQRSIRALEKDVDGRNPRMNCTEVNLSSSDGSIGYTKVAVFAVKQTRCKRTPFSQDPIRSVHCYWYADHFRLSRPSHHDVIFVTCDLVVRKLCRINSKSMGPNVRTR